MAPACVLPLSSRSMFSTRGEDIDRDFDGAPLPLSPARTRGISLVGWRGPRSRNWSLSTPMDGPCVSGACSPFRGRLLNTIVQRASGGDPPGPDPCGARPLTRLQVPSASGPPFCHLGQPALLGCVKLATWGRIERNPGPGNLACISGVLEKVEFGEHDLRRFLSPEARSCKGHCG